jgi:hypothetical protein
MSALPIADTITAETLAQRWGTPLGRVRGLATQCHLRGPFSEHQVNQIWDALLVQIARSVAWRSFKRGTVPPSLGVNDAVNSPRELVQDLINTALVDALEACEHYRAEGKPEPEILARITEAAKNALKRQVKREWKQPTNNARELPVDDPDSDKPDAIFDDYRVRKDRAIGLSSSEQWRLQDGVTHLVTFGKHHLSAVRAAQDMGYSAVRTALELGALTPREAYTEDDPKKRDRVAKRVERLRQTGVMEIDADGKRHFPKSEITGNVEFANVDARQLAAAIREADAQQRWQNRRFNEVHKRPRAPRRGRSLIVTSYGWPLLHAEMRPAPLCTYPTRVRDGTRDPVIRPKDRIFLEEEIHPVGLFKLEPPIPARGVSGTLANVAFESKQSTSKAPRLFSYPAFIRAAEELQAETHCDYLFWCQHALPATFAVIETCQPSSRTKDRWKMPEWGVWKIPPDAKERPWLFRKQRVGFNYTPKRDPRKEEKREKLRRLAERPGTFAEGQLAREMLKRLERPSVAVGKGLAFTMNARDLQRLEWIAAQRQEWEENLKREAVRPRGHEMSVDAMVRDFNQRRRLALTLAALLVA